MDVDYRDGQETLADVDRKLDRVALALERIADALEDLSGRQKAREEREKEDR